MGTRFATVAVCYDFDGTLSPSNMQEYDFIPQLDIRIGEFWKEASESAREHQADNILMYMTLMLDKAKASNRVQVFKSTFSDFGRNVPLFPGVEEYFGRIGEYARQKRLTLEHYIISSGLREMIEGTPIARHFRKIYASSFAYDQHGVAKWPGLAINFTTKTQYLFRINKGALDVWDNSAINAFTPMEERPIPFSRMIYLGDGATDVPCMKLVKDKNGHSIAVYKPNSRTRLKVAEQLLEEDRVNLIAPADYREGKTLDRQLRAIIDKIAADLEVEKLERACRKAKKPKADE